MFFKGYDKNGKEIFSYEVITYSMKQSDKSLSVYIKVPLSEINSGSWCNVTLDKFNLSGISSGRRHTQCSPTVSNIYFKYTKLELLGVSKYGTWSGEPKIQSDYFYDITYTNDYYL